MRCCVLLLRFAPCDTGRLQCVRVCCDGVRGAIVERGDVDIMQVAWLNGNCSFV